MPADVPGLSLVVAQSGTDVMLRPVGEIDVSSASVMTTCAEAVVESTTGDIVVDLSAVTFMDSSALHVLITLHRRLVVEERRLRVENVGSSLYRLFEISGVGQHLGLDAPQRTGVVAPSHPGARSGLPSEPQDRRRERRASRESWSAVAQTSTPARIVST